MIVDPTPQPENTPNIGYSQIRQAFQNVGFKVFKRSIQSYNFVTGSAGWRLTAAGDLEASSGTFRGTITATVGAIGGFTIASGVLTGNGTTGKIQTASSGARVVIDSTSNSLKLYDSVGQVIGIGIGVGQAITLSLTSATYDGILVTSAVEGIGFQYINSSNVISTGVFVSITGTSAGDGIQVEKGGSGNGILCEIIAGSSSKGFQLVNAGTSKGMILTQSTNDVVLDISHTATASANPTFQIVKTAVGPIARFVSSVNSASNNFGIEIDVQNAGAGLEHAFDFQGAEKVNAAVGGTQDYKIRVRIGGTTYFIPCYTA